MMTEKTDRFIEVVIPVLFLAGVSLAIVEPWLGLDLGIGMVGMPLLAAAFVCGLALVPAIYLARDFGNVLIVLVVLPMAVLVLSGFYFLPIYLPPILLAADFPFDMNLVTGFLGFWWFLAVLNCASGFLPAGTRVANSILPDRSEPTEAMTFVLAPFSLTMPWLAFLAPPLRAACKILVRVRERFSKTRLGCVFTLVYRLAAMFAFAALPVILVIEARYIVPAVFVVIVVGLHVLVAFVEPKDEPILRRSTLPGAILCSIATALGYAVWGSGKGIVLGWALLAMAGFVVFPLMVAARLFTHKVARFATLAVLLEAPLAYYPLFVDTADRILIASHSVQDLADGLGSEEAGRVLPKAFEKMVREGRPVEAAQVAVRWVPRLLQGGDIERAQTVTQQALGLLGEVPFDRDTSGLEGTLHSRRDLVLTLLVDQVRVVLAAGNRDEAERTALDTWRKVVQAGAWDKVGRLARVMAEYYRSVPRNTDAYWWLADARNRIVRGGGPPEEVERLNEAIADLRRAIGEDAFRSAVAECAHKDPEWCGNGTE